MASPVFHLVFATTFLLTDGAGQPGVMLIQVRTNLSNLFDGEFQSDPTGDEEYDAIADSNNETVLSLFVHRVVTSSTRHHASEDSSFSSPRVNGTRAPHSAAGLDFQRQRNPWVQPRNQTQAGAASGATVGTTSSSFSSSSQGLKGKRVKMLQFKGDSPWSGLLQAAGLGPEPSADPDREWMAWRPFYKKYGGLEILEMHDRGMVQMRPMPDSPRRNEFSVNKYAFARYMAEKDKAKAEAASFVTSSDIVANQWIGPASLHDMFTKEAIIDLLNTGRIKFRDNPEFPGKMQYMVVMKTVPSLVSITSAESFNASVPLDKITMWK